MLYKNETDFAKALDKQPPQGTYLLFGSEEYLIDAWKKRITKPFSQAGAFNLQVLDGRDLDCEALYDAVETLPLMAQSKCVLVEGLDTGRAAVDMGKISDIISYTGPDCVLIFTGKGAFDPKSASGKKWIKLVTDTGAAVELGSRGAAGLLTFVVGVAKRQGCSLSTEMGRLIISTCGQDMNQLRCETEKICAYAGPGAITRAHIEAVATPHLEARVFDLSKAILAKNPGRALQILTDLARLREEPIAVLSTLILTYVDLYRARVAKNSGVALPVAVEKLGYRGRDFRLSNAFGSRLSEGAIHRALEALYDCDRKMKGSGVDNQILLEQTVVRLLMAGAAS